MTQILQTMLAQFSDEYLYSAGVLIPYYLVLISIITLALCYLINKIYFLAILRDMRWLRIFHYLLMLILGCALAIRDTTGSYFQFIFNKNPTFLSDFLFTIVSIICVGLFSIITNNSADQEIDKISNQTRPLIVKSIPSSTYMCIGYVALLMGLVYASMVNIKTLVIIGVVTAIYFIYSMPPIRFKRVPVLSKLAISFNSLALILLGYLLLNNNLLQFPKVLLPIFLISYTIAANFIDIKDYEGDRHAGVVTLPGLLGLQKAKFFISAAFICTYASFVLLLKNLEDFYLLLAGGIIQAFFVLRAPYNEKRIFQFHLLSVITLIALVLA